LHQLLLFYGNRNRSFFSHRTQSSGPRIAVAVDQLIDGPDDTCSPTVVEQGWSRTTIGARLEPSQRLGLTKMEAHGWSSERSWRRYWTRPRQRVGR
jgi:hypothetical protein